MKKKILCVLLVALMLIPCFSLGGCGKEQFEVNFWINTDALSKYSYQKTISDVEKGSLIKPIEYADHTIYYMKRLGFKFGGWYQEPECLNAWAFYTDKVYCDINLYAKWITIES